MALSNKERLVKQHIVEALCDLEPLFVPGMKLTFIARHPTNPEAHVLVTGDTIDEIRKALDTCRPKETT